MAEARTEEEEEENLRPERREPPPPAAAARRHSAASGGRPERRKPEHRHSQGPLSSIRAAIKRTSTRTTSLSETSRDRDRDRDRDRRRPEITILSAEPLASTSWFPGASGGFPPPPPPAAQIWGPTIPPSVQPPPSYEEVIREKSQEQVVLPPSSSSSSSSPSGPVRRITIATQTDTGPAPAPPESPVRRPVRPPRPPAPPPSRSIDDIAASLSTPASLDAVLAHPEATTTTGGRDLLGDLSSADLPPERPRPRPRSKLHLQPAGSEVKVQTLVKLRDDGAATLAAAAARTGSDARDPGQGKYLQELLEAFSSDDWGVPDRRSDSSGISQSESEEGEDGEDMAALRARIQAFEQQQQAADGGSAKPEPRPRPRLQGPPGRSGPPAVAPKPKSFPPGPKPSSKVFWEDGDAGDAPPQSPTDPEKPPVSPKPQSTPETPVPAPRPPPRPSVAPRASLGAAPQDRGTALAPPPRPHMEACEKNQPARAGSVRPNVPSKPAALTSPRRASAPNLSPKPGGASPPPPEDPDPASGKPCAPPKPAVPAPAPASRKAAAPGPTNAADPPLPPRPSSVKLLPLRPPPIKSSPGRPPPPAIGSASSTNQIAPSTKAAPDLPPVAQVSPVTANQKPAKRGPPLPPRPKPGHPLYSSCVKQEVLIVLDDPSPAPPEQLPQTVAPSQSLLDLDPRPEPVPDQDGRSKAALEDLGLSDSQSILPEPKEQQDAPISGPRCVATFDYEGEEDDELTFSQGDVIALLELVDQQWGRGQIHGRVGVFPLSFTAVLEPLPPAEVKSDPEAEEWAVALYDFLGQTADDLSFHKGALIRVTERVDADWRRGRLDGKEGLYPAAFTQPCQAQPITEQQLAVKGSAKVLFDFTAENEDELTLKVGDIITQVEPVDEQWILGVVGGRRGIVPKNYVSPL